MDTGTPHYFGHRQRLRQRFQDGGLSGLADYEIVELILTLAIPRSDVKRPAKALINRFGAVTPIALKIIRATATLYLQQSSEARISLAESRELVDFWRMRIGALPNEVFEVAYLDSAYRMLRDGVERVEEGTIDRAAVYPRRVIEGALKRGAAAIVLAHNHPNGNAAPSEHDKALTRAIVLAAETLHLRVADHLIIGREETFSFRQAGLL
jgi:DNA repair protein RadC